MTKNTVRTIDRFIWTICISLLIIFILTRQYETIYLWSENIEISSHKYIGEWSYAITPINALTFSSFIFSMIAIFVFQKISFIESILSFTVFGSFVLYLGFVFGVLPQYLLAASIGTAIHLVTTRLFSKLSPYLPTLVDSQNWRETILKFDCGVPGYWIVSFNILFAFSLTAFPIVLIQTWAPAELSWIISIVIGSLVYLLGLHFLKKEKIFGYCLWSLPYCFMAYHIYTNYQVLKFIYPSNISLFLKHAGSFISFFVVTIICCINWKRLTKPSYRR